jgi:hypothetical protein
MHEDGAVGVAGAVGVGVAGSAQAQLTLAGHLGVVHLALESDDCRELIERDG